MQLYSIGQASSMIDLPIGTIRYYESIGLCSPSHIDEDSGYRYYSIDDIFRLDFIRTLGPQLGMPLKTIQQYMKDSDKPGALTEYLSKQERELDNQIRELQRRKNFLAIKLAAELRREQEAPMSPSVRNYTARLLSAFETSAAGLDDAILLARKTASTHARGGDTSLYLIYEQLGSKFESRGPQKITVGISRRVRGKGLKSYVLPEGDYLSISYKNNDADRYWAVEMMEEYMKSHALRASGPMINGGSLIETTALTSSDYWVTSQIRVEKI